MNVAGHAAYWEDERNTYKISVQLEYGGVSWKVV